MTGKDDLEKCVAEIREKVRCGGGFTVDRERLRLLCPDHLTVPQQFARIAAIAQQEQWSFAFLPDGSVHFGSYSNTWK